MGSGDGGYDDVVAVEGLLRQLYESESETDSEDEEEVKGEDSGKFICKEEARGV